MRTLAVRLGGAGLALLLVGARPSSAATPPEPVECGPAWRDIGSPSPNHGRALVGLYDVDALAPDDVWAVGSWEYARDRLWPLIQHWDGHEWRSVGPRRARDQAEFIGIDARTPTDVWAVGEQWMPERPLVVHYDGKRWRRIPIPERDGDSRLRAVAALSARDVWTVGVADRRSGFGPLIEHWDGSRWSEVRVRGLHGVSASLRDIDANSLTDVWAVGSRTAGDLRARSLVVHYDGASWEVVYSPNGHRPRASLASVDMVSPTKGWTVGYRETDDSRSDTLILRWAGGRWRAVPSPSPGLTDNTLYGVTAVGPNAAWAVGEIYDNEPPWHNGAVVLTWDGTRWALTEDDITNPARLDERDTFLASVDAVRSPVDGSPVLWTVGARTLADYDGNGFGGGLFTLTRRMCPVTVSAGGALPREASGMGDQAVTWAVSRGAREPHVLADASGLDLFRSGPLGPRDVLVHAYPGAGSYDVREETTGELSTVVLEGRTRSHSGDEDTRFRIRWGAEPAPEGLRSEVILRRPGSTSFEPWYTGPKPMRWFTPDAGPGTYHFRARVRDDDGAHSGWSPPFSIEVVSGHTSRPYV